MARPESYVQRDPELPSPGNPTVDHESSQPSPVIAAPTTTSSIVFCYHNSLTAETVALA